MQAALWVNKTGPKICQDEILEAYGVCLSCSLQLDVFFVVFFLLLLVVVLYFIRCALWRGHCGDGVFCLEAHRGVGIEVVTMCLGAFIQCLCVFTALSAGMCICDCLSLSQH